MDDEASKDLIKLENCREDPLFKDEEEDDEKSETNSMLEVGGEAKKTSNIQNKSL